MSLLDRKLWRDLRVLRTQALAVAGVMACGLAMMIMTRSLVLSLEATREAYYRDYHFADIFAQMKRAPRSVRDELAAIPGVAAVQLGIAARVTLDLPGQEEPATGLINSLPEFGEATLDRLHLRSGKIPVGRGAPGQILAGEAFAEAHDLRPGGRFSGILNGRKQTFQAAGIVLSPEFIFEAPPGASLPDNRTYGVFWMPYRELAVALNLDGAYNQVALALAPGAGERAVIAAVDRVLAPYGGRGAYGRANHPSHVRVTDEIRVLQGLSVGFPLVFLSVAAFMTNAVMARQVALQREQIAMLKACGFSNAQVGWHYFKFALVIVGAGVGLGTLGGVYLGGQLVALYHLFFRFPAFDFHLARGVLLTAGAASAVAAFAGVAGAVRRAVTLSPAEAMRPEPPAAYRPALIERTRAARWISASWRMALRNIERKRVQSALTCLALALATGILVVPNAFRDGISHVLDFQWDIIQRQTVTAMLNEPGPLAALHDFAHLPGVISVEPVRFAPAEVRFGDRMRRLAVQGYRGQARLDRVIDARSRLVPLPEHGVVVSAKLAEILGARPGDELALHFLEGERRTGRMRITGLAEDFTGIAAYADFDELNRLMGDGDRLSGAHLTVAAGAWRHFLARAKLLPATLSISIKNSVRESFRRTTAQSIGIIQKLYLFFATVVAFGIVYNSARISLSERARELATLRVLGFTQREVSTVLIGELAVLTVVAIPLGIGLGAVIARLIVGTINTETVRLPLVLGWQNFTFAIVVVAVASTLSAWLAARKVAAIDLVSALKSID